MKFYAKPRYYQQFVAEFVLIKNSAKGNALEELKVKAFLLET